MAKEKHGFKYMLAKLEPFPYIVYARLEEKTQEKKLPKQLLKEDNEEGLGVWNQEVLKLLKCETPRSVKLYKV